VPEADPPGTDRLQLAAALLASSVIGAPVVIATAVQTVLYTINPSGIDVTHPLAYAAELTAVLVIAVVGAVIAVALVLSRLKKQAGSRDVLRVPYMILALQVAFAVVAFTLFVFTPRT
jgi:hypothetical protein